MIILPSILSSGKQYTAGEYSNEKEVADDGHTKKTTCGVDAGSHDYIFLVLLLLEMLVTSVAFTLSANLSVVMMMMMMSCSSGRRSHC